MKALSPAQVIAKEQARAKREALELEFATQLRGIHLDVERQFSLPGFRYRWDFCLRSWMLLLEIQGGTWIGGKHTRGQGYQDDCTKARLALLYGWKTAWLTAEDIHSGRGLGFIQDYIKIYPPF